MNLATQDRTELLELHSDLFNLSNEGRLEVLTKILANNPSIIRLVLGIPNSRLLRNMKAANTLGLPTEAVTWLHNNYEKYSGYDPYWSKIEGIKAFRIEFGTGMKESKDAVDWARNTNFDA